MKRKLLYILVLLLMVAQGAGAQSTSDIGKVLAVDGKMYKTVAAATNAGTTASGIIAYWGEAGSVESGNSSYRGMAIALADAFLAWGSYPNHMEYCTSASHQCSTATSYCSTVSTALNAKNGIAATQSAQANNGEGHFHNAVWSSTGVATPSGASTWAIPSVGQWNLMAQGLTGNSSNLSDTDNPDYHFNNLSTKINAAGGTYLEWLFYWSSTEQNESHAWCFNVGGLSGGRNGSRISAFAKNHNDEYMHVRMFFAFSSAEAAVYTISYNANGGSGAPSSQTKDGGIDLTLSSTVPTRTGYTFVGWNTQADGSGTSYASGATFTGNENTTLYAQWNFQGSGTVGDPYLIPSAEAWNLLTEKVNAGTNYSGQYLRLTNDISVTTMVGNSESNSFRGTFDGNGHTLTINYSNNSDYTAPFRYIQGATFKNLKVTGTITTTKNLAAGIAGLNTGSTATFEQCVTDIIINSSSSTVVGWGRYDYHGGLLARTINVDAMITDCVCGGSVDGSSSSNSNCASFVGVAENCTVHATRCLSTTSYTNVNKWNSLSHCADNAYRAVNVFYYVNGNDAANVGTQVTTSQLADGSYATALQAGRSTTVWIQYAAINQPMLKLFALNQATDGYYLIGSEQEWRNFATLIQTTPTANARMTADISVTTMVGATSSHKFSGTYDGDGHTLTVNYNSTAQYAAPFSYADGATFKNLHIAGSITSSAKYVASFVGYSYGSNTFLNCRSSVAITSSISGDGTHGGFVGILEGDNVSDYTVTFEGCVFNGKLLGSNTTNCGGFVGWSQTHRKIRINLSNCLYAPQEVTISISGCQTFSRGQVLSDIFSTNTNNYYIESLGGTQGKKACSISAGDDVTISGLGVASATYNVSGITAYAHGIKYNDVFYAGNGDEVSLTLSHDENPGYTFSHYTVDGGGTLANPTTNSPTLTMTDANQIIGVQWTENKATLNQSNNNSSFISTNNGLVYDITLTRTLQTGGWNTFCVPFNISSAQITSKFGEGTKVRELGGSDFNSTTKQLTLNFTNATSIEAGKPYLVYLGSASNVANPTFNDVTISNSTTTKTTTYADFVPVMNPTPLTGGDKTVLFVTGGNKLTYPSKTGNLNGFRAYFKLQGDAAANARSFEMAFDDKETTEITTTDFTDYTDKAGAWYTIDGRKFDQLPSAKGIYVINGRKVVIK